MNIIELARQDNTLLLKINSKIKQIYPVNNSTITIKEFPEEVISENKTQTRFFIHIIGISDAYQFLGGIDIFQRSGGSTDSLIVNEVDCTNNPGEFLNNVIALYA